MSGRRFKRGLLVSLGGLVLVAFTAVGVTAGVWLAALWWETLSVVAFVTVPVGLAVGFLVGAAVFSLLALAFPSLLSAVRGVLHDRRVHAARLAREA